MTFQTSRAFLLFDYFRVPYVRAELPTDGLLAELRQSPSTPALRWLNEPEQGVLGGYRLDGIPVYAHLLPDAAVVEQTRELGGSWRRTLEIRDLDDTVRGSVWEDADGNVLLPFDPSEAIENLWSERYLTVGSGAAQRARTLAMRSYYRLRPALPRSVQLRLRRTFTRLQRQQSFPRWPVETALHDLYDLLFRLVRGVASGPIAMIAPWPKPFTWALVLTHDVESQVGYDYVDTISALERANGFSSAFYFVPERDYRVEDALVETLLQDGHEVGVHGLRHDGLEFDTLATLKSRIPAIRAYAERWKATGFRSASTHRVWEWMPLLGFDYDSSYTDTAPYEPQPGGCCSWLPYANQSLIEIPMTLPQDHTVFEILQQQDEQLWVEKATFLRERGGLAAVLTHPDYMIDNEVLRAYERFLVRFSAATEAWRPLPQDVAAWWRDRAASRLEWADGRWEVVGPAASRAAIALIDAGA